MKQRQLVALASMLLVLGVLLSATSSAAKSKKTTVDFWEVSCEKDAGMAWISDGVLHGRGRHSEAVFYVEDPPGVPKVVGTDVVVSNANIDLATGDGRAFGTFTLIYILPPGSATGTFDGTFAGNVTGGLSFSGRIVGHGTGDLRGKKMKLSVESEQAPEWLAPVMVPCEPPTAPPLPAVYHNTGFIHDPKGD